MSGVEDAMALDLETRDANTDLTLSGDPVGQELLMAAAVKLYELGKLSSGAAANLAGVPRAVFLTRIADYGVDTFVLDEYECQQETPLA